MPVEVQSNQLNALSVILLILALVALSSYALSQPVLESEKNAFWRFGFVEIIYVCLDLVWIVK